MYKTDRRVQYLAGICAALTFMYTGAALSWSSPAIPKFKNGDAELNITDAQVSWAVALLSVGALPGCYLGQLLSERLGRRLTIFFGAVPALTGSTIILFTKLPSLMYVARLLSGVSTGMIAVVTMIYITEIADKDIRGQLGMTVQVMNNLGSLLVYCIGPFVSYNALNTLVLSIPVGYVIFCSWIPESPYYHLKDGRMEDARKTYMVLKGTKDKKWADQQLNFIGAHVKANMENKTTFWELLTNMKYRRALYIVAGLKILQYMTGNVAIQAYLEMIFRKSSSVSGPVASIVYGFVQLLAGISATFLAGWFGRRVLMFVSCLGVAVAMTLIGIYFFLLDYIQVGPATLSAISFLPMFGILSFNILYTIGVGNLPYVLQAELFPINVKVVASSSATMMACVLSFLVTKCYQVIKDACGLYSVFWFFSVIAYLGVLFIYYCVPETKGKTLEEVLNNLEKVPEEEPLNDLFGDNKSDCGIKINIKK